MTAGRLARSDRLSGRAAAVRAIRAAISGDAYVADQVRSWRAAGRLDPREAGLALEIGQGTIRHWFLIRRLLSSVADYDERRIKPEVRAILHSAAYQIVWMDRIPEFAAVDEAVSTARTLAGVRAGGMVNAILRVLTRAIDARRTLWQRLDRSHIRVAWDQACAFGQPVLSPVEPDGGRMHLADATGQPRDRFDRLVRQLGMEDAEGVSWASQAVPPLILHRNSLRASAEHFSALVGEIESAELAGGVAFLPASAPVGDSPLLHDGMAYVQDTTAARAVDFVQARPGERILDCCAAPGGKSLALAQAMNDRGEVVACDASAERLERVRENAGRLGLRSIRAQPDDFADAGEFDAALVDVPCSNSGVLARRPEARFRLTPEHVGRLAALQGRLLTRAAGCVRTGGRLVYSTCSIEPEENQDVVTAFARSTPGWRLEASELTLPRWGARLAEWRDGGFVARLRRD